MPVQMNFSFQLVPQSVVFGAPQIAAQQLDLLNATGQFLIQIFGGQSRPVNFALKRKNEFSQQIVFVPKYFVFALDSRLRENFLAK